MPAALEVVGCCALEGCLALFAMVDCIVCPTRTDSSFVGMTHTIN